MIVSRKLIAQVVLLLSVSCLLLFAEINQFPIILGFFTTAFLAYFYLLYTCISLKNGLILAVSLRMLAIFCFPGLSDDIYRFIWDGWLVTEGINPFKFLPSEIPLDLNTFQEYLLNKMNSPDYYSVYPPILQGLFSSAVYIIPEAIIWQSIYIKTILIGFECLTIYLSIRILKSIGKSEKSVLIYALNPLVIVELMGNLHMELLMISFFTVFLFYLNRYFQSKSESNSITYLALAAVGLVFSVSSKLITLIVAPFLIRRVKPKGLIIVSFVSILLGGLMFYPLLSTGLENFTKGLDLYFQKFEFNASVYYLIRQIGYWFKGYNIISSLGPVLGIISTILILILAFLKSDKTISSISLYLSLALVIYYFLGTTVHPWYISVLIFLSVFSTLKFVIFWSFLAVFSYSKYYLYIVIKQNYILLQD